MEEFDEGYYSFPTVAAGLPAPPAQAPDATENSGGGDAADAAHREQEIKSLMQEGGRVKWAFEGERAGDMTWYAQRPATVCTLPMH